MTDPGRAVFLSYASQDGAAALRIATALRDAGIEVWFDQSELRGGDAWDTLIKQQIKACALFVPIISANTQSRFEGYFRLEWKLAVDRSHQMATERAFLLPVVIDATDEAVAHVPERFREAHWTRLPDGATSPAFAERIGRLLAAGGALAVDSLRRRAATTGPAAGAAGSRSIPRTIAGVALVVAAVLAYLLVDRLRPVGQGAPADAARVPATATLATALPAVDDKSIAVLPFVDMSAEHKQEYFSDGLAEEIIDRLAHSPDLKVIARTSSFQFKGQNEDMRRIGARLAVANLLEGSVRTSGRRVRVTAQLIRVADGTHRWSETYDANMADIFKVQDTIAGAVVAALHASLAQAAPAAGAPVNPDAYAPYLRGRYLNQRQTAADTRAAMAEFRRAIELDPNYALAWAGLAGCFNVLAANGWMRPQEAYAQMRPIAERALALGPTLAPPHRMMAAIYLNADRNFAAGNAEFNTARGLDPNANTVLLDGALNGLAAGDLDAAVSAGRLGAERDPLSVAMHEIYAMALSAAGRLDDAERVLRTAIGFGPTAADLHAELGDVLTAKHEPERALEEIEGETNEASRLAALANAYWALGRRTEADARLHELETRHGDTHAAVIAECYAARGDKDAAFKWLDRSFDNLEPYLGLMRGDYLLRPLRGDARYQALLKRMKI